MAASSTLVIPDDLSAMFDGIPRYWGYSSVASVTPRRTNQGGLVLGSDGQPRMVGATTIRGYYYADQRHGEWTYVPPPDIILLRTDGSPLPGWSPSTIEEWQMTRPGAGSRTAGPYLSRWRGVPPEQMVE